MSRSSLLGHGLISMDVEIGEVGHKSTSTNGLRGKRASRQLTFLCCVGASVGVSVGFTPSSQLGFVMVVRKVPTLWNYLPVVATVSYIQDTTDLLETSLESPPEHCCTGGEPEEEYYQVLGYGGDVKG